MPEDNVPLAGAVSPSLMVSRDPEAHSEDSWQGGNNGDLKRSSDKWTAQQIVCAQDSLHGSHHQPSEGGHITQHLQGAGGRRCELDGKGWELGSSDGAAPEPMGLSVVIRLGWPRSVRVMVVGTFKPDAWLEI